MTTHPAELVFILDRSGSMGGLERDTIGGFNGMIEKQKNEAGEAFVTTVLFDHEYELLHDRLPLPLVPPMTEKEYFVRGSTALLDAVGKTIARIAHLRRTAPDGERAGRVLFVIITDGMENASREFTYNTVTRMIDEKRRRFGWEFLFLGANMDAVAAAARMGIGRDRAVNYHADSMGTQLNYMVLNETITMVRTKDHIPENWKEAIEKDYKSR